jgi:hypothetical protein
MVGIFSADRAMQAAENVEKSAGQAACDADVTKLEELQSAIKAYQW